MTEETGDQCYDSGGQVSLDVESSDWIYSPVWSDSDRQQGNCPRKPKERDRREQSSARFTEDGHQYALTSGHCVYDQKTKTLISPGAVQEKLTQTSHNPNLVQILMRIRSSSQSC